MISSRKRKQRPEFNTNYHRSRTLIHDDAEQVEQGHSYLFIQAYEADIIRGPRASQAATSLEVFDYGDQLSGMTLPVRKVGDALIQWGENRLGKLPEFPGDEDDFTDSSKQAAAQPRNDYEKNAVWVDRYDARLLLDAVLLPSPSTNAMAPVPDSPGGWSDIPSDSEDTFFFSPEETEDFRREKKRKLLDQNREERLRARRIEDGESIEAEDDDEMWGGSDEEPDDPQRELMRRTAQHILSSPNPALLEMRILANHGGDKKFAFLRGRWTRAWIMLKGKARREKEGQEKERQDKKESGLGVLAGYGDSEDESEGDGVQSAGDANYHREAEDAQDKKAGVADHKPWEDDEAAKKARRARAKEWAEKRRAS